VEAKLNELDAVATSAAATQIKPNRKHRRATEAYQRKIQGLTAASQRLRLENFKVLSAWKDSQKKLSEAQVNSVFRVALSKLFKKSFASKAEFQVQLTAIIRNVRNGFKYKSDVEPAAANTSEG